jgi:two-component system, OmpR family, phosphate regulon sensor histidine kinase PhoR
MPIDHRRLFDGLNQAASMVEAGEAGLVAIDVLISAARDACEASGATFTEYGDAGGRVVVARGDMTWTLGQPIGAQFIDPPESARPWSGLVDGLPVELAEPLLSRGVVALAGYPVHVSQRPVGSINLFFGEFDEEKWAATEPVLRVVAAATGHILSEIDMRPGKAAAEEDDRTLFLAVAGHELRTPVTVLKGYASLLSDRWDGLDELDRRAAARVLTQRADELARLVDRLLGASVDDGTAGWLVRTVPFDPLETLLRAAGDLPVELRRSLRLELPNSLPPASGDPAIVSSVVTELVTNAVRASQSAPNQSAKGEAQPSTVELLAGADAHTVFIRVCDRGEGIDPTNAERAFERFWRARRGGDSRGGVGLGLYLVRRLVERQNGWVSLRPRDGGGTIAEVRLPRADGPLRPSVAGEA